jgi:hypothetical protein
MVGYFCILPKETKENNRPIWSPWQQFNAVKCSQPDFDLSNLQRKTGGLVPWEISSGPNAEVIDKHGIPVGRLKD